LLHGLLWTILCGAFVFVGAQKLWPVITTGKIRPVQPFDSTDRYLEWFFKGDGGSMRILRVLENIPRDKAIALVLSDAGKENAFVYQIVIYLSWPREIQWVILKPETAETQLKSLNPNSLGAIIFWRTQPPDWLGTGVQFGPQQTIVPLSQSSEPHQ
jgi:hypothetical protein